MIAETERKMAANFTATTSYTVEASSAGDDIDVLLGGADNRVKISCDAVTQACVLKETTATQTPRIVKDKGNNA